MLARLAGRSSRNPTRPQPMTRRLAAFLACTASSLGAASAQVQVKLTASNAAAGDGFGSSVAFDEGSIAVGAPLDDHVAGVDAGSVYTFSPSGSGWVQDGHIWIASVTAGAEFGRTLALDGDTLAVGAWRDARPAGLHSGSVWVFARVGSTWTLRQRIIAGDATAGDEFGAGLALSGDWLAIGAPSRPFGAVYLYRRISGIWLNVQRLNGFYSTSPGDDFGWSLAFDGAGQGGSLLVGAPGQIVNWFIGGVLTPIPDAGRVFEYRNANGVEWLRASVFGPRTFSWGPGGPSGVRFGGSVAAYGGQAAIGDELGVELLFRPHMAHSHFVVRRLTWSARDPSTIPQPVVGISSRALAWGVRTTGLNRGHVDRFARSAPSDVIGLGGLLAFDGQAQDRFGSAVEADAGSIVVGAPGDDHAGGVDAGSAYVLPDPCPSRTWNLSHPGGTGAPAARSAHAMSSFGALRQVVLFGGDTSAPGPAVGDTWTWNGGSWQQRSPTFHPSVRMYATMVDATPWNFPSAVLLLGGVSFGGSLATELLVQWDGTDWTPITSTGPAPTNFFTGNGIYRHRAVWDSARHCMVVYGGGPQMPLTDTWEWRRTGATTGNWTQLNTYVTGNPGSRVGHAMAYDPVRRLTILHGGRANLGGTSAVVGDTWSWNGQAWTQLSTTGTGPLENHVMEFDRAAGRIVLTAGISQPGDLPNQLTWTWDGAQWASLPASTTGPTEMRIETAMAWDPVQARLMLFGGTGGTVGTGPYRGDTHTWCGGGD